MSTPPLPLTPSNGDNRRRFPRYNTALDIAFGPLSSDATPPPLDTLERTLTVNLSLGGLCFYSNVLYPIGTQLSCVLTVPGRAKPLELIGTTVWFTKVDQATHEYRLGIEFIGLTPTQRAILQELFDRPLTVQSAHAKTLLLVDDDPELQLALKLRFETAGFRVLTASDGLEALRKGREERPHLIILDLMLPQMNGYEVCRLLKFDQQYARIPIMIFSARSRRQDVELGTAVGADAYLIKPCSGTELIAKVEALLNGTRG